MGDGLTVLIVDDSAPMRAIIGAVVSAGGHRPDFADSVEVGMNALKRHCPDVVLTDYNMPGQSGRDLVLQLRAAGFDNPIFVISSECEAKLRTALAGADVSGWFAKPICAAELLDVLDGMRRNDLAASPSSPAWAAAPPPRPIT